MASESNEQEEIEVVKFTGYHGTNAANEASIVENNFRATNNRDLWAGNGVYFFIKGIGNPINHAEDWATTHSWNKNEKAYRYLDYIVLEAEILADDDKILDLTVDDGVVLFNKFRDKMMDVVRREKKRLTNRDYRDTDVIELMKRKIGLEVVKGHFYVRFAEQRIGDIRSNIPNSTFISVLTPKDVINKESINVVVRKTIDEKS